MQRAAGNHSVGPLLQRSAATHSGPSLRIGSPDSPEELEADRVAAKVMRMPDNAMPPSIGLSSPTLHRKCAACNREEEKLHRSASGESPGTAPPIVNQVLSQPGQPLPESTRSFFEPCLGADLSRVRIHTDSKAAESAEAVQAKAYTVGESIAFASGEYSPQSESGKWLLAHELTHVMQYAVAAPARSRLMVNPENPITERETNAGVVRTRTRAPAAHLPSQFIGGTLRRESAGMTSGTAPQSVPAPEVNQSTAAPAANLCQDEAGQIARIRWYLENNTSFVDSVPPFIALAFVPSVFAPVAVGTLLTRALRKRHLESMWDSFGPRLPEVAAANYELFDTSLKRGVDVDNLDSLKPLRSKFEADVKQLALNNMFANRKFIQSELKKFGEEDGVKALTFDDREETTQIQMAAGEVARAEQYQEFLRNMTVGYYIPTPIGEHRSREPKILFDPIAPPSFSEDVVPGDQVWAEVKKKYDETQSVITGLIKRFPSLGALRTVGAIETASGAATPQEARKVLAGAYREVLGNLERTVERLGTDDLDYRDLQPIHAKLFAGTDLSGTNWSSALNQRVAIGVLEDHEQIEFWIAMGLTTVSAAAFIAAEFATAGMATLLVAVSVTASGVQAARSWENFFDLAEASKAHTDERYALVSSGQASEALTSALLDTVFFFIDAAGGVKLASGKMRPPLRAGGISTSRSSAEHVAKELTDFEVAEYAARSGHSVEGGTTRQVLAASADGNLKLTQSGFLFKCASPCRIFRERYAAVLIRNPKLEQRVADLERRLQDSASAVVHAEKRGAAAEAATLREQAQSVFRGEAESLDSQLHALDSQLADEWGRLRGSAADTASSGERLPAVATHEDLKSLRNAAPQPGRPPVTLAGNDLRLWDEYAEYFEERLIRLEQDLLTNPQAIRNPPRTFDSYRNWCLSDPKGCGFLAGVRRGNLFQLKQHTELVSQEGFGVASNVGLSHSMLNEVKGNIKYVDHFIVNPDGSIICVSSKSHDFAAVLARNSEDAAPAMKEILSQVIGDVDELIDKYGGWVTVRREGLMPNGEPVKVTELVLNLDGRRIPNEIKAEIQRVAVHHAFVREPMYTFSVAFSQ